MWDEGMPELEICERLHCSRTLLDRALQHWYDARGLERPDGRRCKKRLKGHRKAVQMMDEIMSRFHRDMPIMKIAEELGCCAEIVREAVERWHRERDVPVPDGRARRRELRLKQQSSKKTA